MKYLVIFLVLIGISLSYSHLPYAESRIATPLYIVLEDNTIKQSSFIIANGGVPIITIQKEQTVSFPLKVIPSTSEPLPVNFVHDIEYAVSETHKSTLPDMKIEFDPFHMVLKPDESQIMNVIITTLNYTQLGERRVTVTAQYPQGETVLNTGFDVLVIDENQYGNTKSLENFDESFSITEKQVQYNIPYKITNGIIDDVTLSCDDGSLLLQVTTQDESDVTLILALSRNILDPKIDGRDDKFIVLRDGQEIDYEEIPYAKYRKLSMSFSAGTNEIEIIHSFIPELKPKMCEAVHDPPYSYILSPLKQFKSGIAINEIQCKENLVLVQKYDNSPACITESTKLKLLERGWVSKGSVCMGAPSTQFDENCVRKKNHSESESSLSTQFEEIKNNIEKTGYGICGIQLEGEKIIIHLNWIFEDSEQEQEIISKIPDDIDYEIIYYDDYVDFSPQTLRELHCDSLEIDDNNFPHVGEFGENEN